MIEKRRKEKRGMEEEEGYREGREQERREERGERKE